MTSNLEVLGALAGAEFEWVIQTESYPLDAFAELVLKITSKDGLDRVVAVARIRNSGQVKIVKEDWHADVPQMVWSRVPTPPEEKWLFVRIEQLGLDALQARRILSHILGKDSSR